MKKLTLAVVVLLVAAGIWSQMPNQNLKQAAMIEVASMAGDVAEAAMGRADEAVMGRADEAVMGRADSERANQLHSVPISIEKINDYIYQARGIGNAHVIATSEGHVMFDSGISIQAADQLKALQEVLPEGDISHIIVSHSHADHSGGVRFWQQPQTEIVAHDDFAEEQRYLTELEPYFWNRNRLLFPFMPETPAGGVLAYGGIEPTVTVSDWDVYKFEQGGVEFEVYGTPGAEGADNVVLWLPQEKILFSGDTFGPLFPQFPNVFTLRGEKVRKPVEYMRSLGLMIALQPEIIVPGHFSPVVGIENTVGGMQQMHDALQYVHDAVVAGMNGGKTMYQLMNEITLPAELKLTQGHGKVSWAVKSIWEYYATWFHFESTTELYGVPVRDVYAEVGALAGAGALTTKAAAHRKQAECVQALHLLEMALAAEPGHQGALNEQLLCLGLMLEQAKVLNNTYEVMWLESQIAITQGSIDG